MTSTLMPRRKKNPAPPVRLPGAAIYALSISAGMTVYPGLIIARARRRLPKAARTGSSVLSRYLGGGLIVFGLHFFYRAIRILA